MISKLYRAALCALAVSAADASAQQTTPITKNPVFGTGGYTAPGTFEAGPAYVGPIISRWGKAVTPDNAWRSYPRPQLVRRDWLNLNGNWDFALTKASAGRPERMDARILVPFPVESRLSGVARKVLPDDRMWYRRSFTVPSGWAGKRTILHFGAVDYEAQVFVNGVPVGGHRGSSDPFSFDITDHLRPGANELVVHVADPTSTGEQSRGKQTLEPRGIWYTAVSGIWQTVWLEAVPDLYITDLRTTPDIDAGTVGVEVTLNRFADPARAVRVTASAGGRPVASTLMRGNRKAVLAIPKPRLWSPDDPFLYDLSAEVVTITEPTTRSAQGDAPLIRNTRAEAEAVAAARVVDASGDRVDSYFGMRKISVGPNGKGQPVMLLNNKPLFHNGTLDQGWWPDGLLTPPSEDAARSDMIYLKKAGFNMLRKHIKVEPARYYYDADRLGMLIWQDMPSGALGDQALHHESDREATMSSEGMAQYQAEVARVIGALRAFPSIVMWVTSNEGWGQYNAALVARITKGMDPTRLVNATSGWVDTAGDASDVFDIHSYHDVPSTPSPRGGRALVLGEFGGIGLAVPGHVWFPERENRLYQTSKSTADYLANYRRKFAEVVRQAKEAGLSASVYTETTDVEGELNGFLTYDRAVEKVPAATLAQIAAPLFEKK